MPGLRGVIRGSQEPLERDWTEASLIADRRDLHRHPETGWTEFRTTAIVVERLRALGYSPLLGADVCQAASRRGVPDPEALDAAWSRARAEGVDGDLLETMRGGMTGAVALRRWGRGPVVALRFDMDALDLMESEAATHRPLREGFASVHKGICHACGHDGHVAIGLGVAHALARSKHSLQGTLKLIFQPAEEGVRGARSIVEAGHLDDVDIVVGCHVLTGWALGELAPGLGGYAATRKLDVLFRGEAAHAGGMPEGGRNALLAAATAAVHLHALPRHHAGFTRVHVGRLTAGSGRNVIPEQALLVAEVRGETMELCAFMAERALAVVTAAASMYGCTVEVRPMGEAGTARSDPDLARRIEHVASAVGDFHCFAVDAVGGSEDFTEMMLHVQERGGMAAYVGLGADLTGVHRDDADRSRVLAAHTSTFDFDERVLGGAVSLLSGLVVDVLGGVSPRSERSDVDT
ncbi:MAG: amidohydrolase [Candidatus Bipolaricaulota bacterium]